MDNIGCFKKTQWYNSSIESIILLKLRNKANSVGVLFVNNYEHGSDIYWGSWL